MEALSGDLLEHVLLCVAWTQDLARASRLVCRRWRDRLSRDWFRRWHETRKHLHAARVCTLIEDEEALNPGAPRLIYGRGTQEPIRPYQEAMNAVALGLLKNNPQLVRWDGSRIKVAPLMEEAKIVLNSTYEFNRRAAA